MNTCYDSAMSEDDKLINFIANTVESLRQRVDTISEQMATKVDLANLRDEMVTEFAAVEEQMGTKDELAAVKCQRGHKNKIKNSLAAARYEIASKKELVPVETHNRVE